jgi:hypothetical protein
MLMSNFRVTYEYELNNQKWSQKFYYTTVGTITADIVYPAALRLGSALGGCLGTGVGWTGLTIHDYAVPRSGYPSGQPNFANSFTPYPAAAGPAYSALKCRLLNNGGTVQAQMWLRGLPQTVITPGSTPPNYGPLPAKWLQAFTLVQLILQAGAPGSGNSPWAISTAAGRNLNVTSAFTDLVFPDDAPGYSRFFCTTTPTNGQLILIKGITGVNSGRLNGRFRAWNVDEGVSFDVRWPTKWRMPAFPNLNGSGWLPFPTTNLIPIILVNYLFVEKRDTGAFTEVQRGAARKEK